MYPVLALDTACQGAVAVLWLNETDVHTCSDTGRQHSKSMIPLLRNLLHMHGLQWQDIKMLVLSHGPGSFTGVRVGSALFSGINTVLDVPMLPISSLLVTALQSGIDDQPVHVIENAYAGEAFYAQFQHGKVLYPPACLSWSTLSTMAIGCYLSHDQEAERQLIAATHLPLQRSRETALVTAVHLQLQDVDVLGLERDVQPLYLQISQAERGMVRG
ncbi:MAG: tRNA (adenosine(37)-N6)-threonylcarbamoyltransferase complex dimerization subunit type 1 TsaB [Zetaproteobacteria bacterium]|nr:tRNA (adenosine(37)-N6)-threonylcarbamoyltransferase complex dimerization subunit type 1 TsaB [Zetaproteobacteria bacterium]